MEMVDVPPLWIWFVVAITVLALVWVALVWGIVMTCLVKDGKIECL